MSAMIAAPLHRSNQSPVDLAFATAFLFAAAVGQIFLFFWQLRLIGESLRDAKIAAEAAKESADATKIQAMVARDTLTKVQRPYVFVFGVAGMPA